ncbi:MAG: hypothetical protein IT561_24495 [Alphaproteobacteria bacterium]|nr:hypothetical protein [Alphaproteobacteria bacterium]
MPIARRARVSAFLAAALLGLCACIARPGTPEASAGRVPPDPPAAPACAAPSPTLEPMAAPPAPTPRRLGHRGDGLAPFHEALARLDARRATAPVSIVILGDSHTAGPYFAGRLRELFQARFGSAGPGAMPPGLAQRGYRNALVAVQQTGVWNGVNSLRATTPPPFGLGLHRLRSDEPGSTITAVAQEPGGFERLEASLVRLPDGGNLRILADGCALGVVATGGAGEAARLVAPLPRGTVAVQIETLDGPVELLGWSLSRGRGALVENHGVNGAQIAMLANLDAAIVAAELSRREPALIVVAFGTNEAFTTDLVETRYRALVEERLMALRRAAPRAALVVAGPPDSAVAGRRAPPAKGRRATGCRWKEPPHLATVKRVLRRAAADMDLPFWDWSRLTKGPCGVDAMARRDPPLAARDHVHFTADGYALAAEALYRFLMDGYTRRRKLS